MLKMSDWMNEVNKQSEKQKEIKPGKEKLTLSRWFETVNADSEKYKEHNENIERIASPLLIILPVALLIFLSYLAIHQLNNGKTPSAIYLMVIFLPMLYTFIKSYKNRNKQK